jgi:hypothetical protein
MSNIALVSPATGTATFSITTPSGTSTDRTLNLPDAAGTLATQDYVDTQALGVGQTWQNVTGSRALGTTYTNSTGRPISVNIVASRSNAAGTLGITVAGVSTGDLAIAQAVQGFVSAIVPNGATYLISGSTLTTIEAWVELR